MILNDGVFGVPLDISGFEPEWPFKRETEDVLIEKLQDGRSHFWNWLVNHIFPQISSFDANLLKGRHCRVDNFSLVPGPPQRWHWDILPPPVTLQILLVVGGSALTDVLLPFEVESSDNFRVKSSAPYSSFPPGTAIVSPFGKFLHRRGGTYKSL